MGKGKILYWREERYDNHCNNHMALSFLRDIFYSNLIYLTISNLNIQDLATINFLKNITFIARELCLTNCIL